MTKNSRFELVSFDLCPYVQRSVITLLHKKIDFKLNFIDLEKPPVWFEKMSPLGKVPLLLVRDPEKASSTDEPVVLFESAVINEYLDEVTPPQLSPKDPLRHAFERAWIQVGSEIMGSIYSLTFSEDEAAAKESTEELWTTLDRVEAILPAGDGKFFRGREFSLVDAAFAPMFMRLFFFKPLKEDPHWAALPKTRRWAESLLGLREVRESVIPEFREKFAALLKKRGSRWADQLA